MEWDTTDPTLLKVKQPAGQVTVTVEFEPEGTRSNEVRLHINTIGSGNGTASVTNTNTSAVLNADGKSTGIQTGDLLDVLATADGSSYVKVEVRSGGTTVYTDVTSAVGQALSKTGLAMLPGDADVYVTFSDEPFDKPLLTVTAIGATGTGSVDVNTEGNDVGTVTRHPLATA